MYLSVKRISILLIGTALFILSVIYLTPLLLPFLLGWLLATTLYPVICKVEKWFKLSRSLATISSMVFFTFITGIMILLFVFFIVKEIFQFLQQLPAYLYQFAQFLYDVLPLETLQQKYFQFQKWYRSYIEPTQNSEHSQFADWMSALTSQIVKLLQMIFTSVLDFLTAIPDVAALLFVSLLSAFFICLEYERIHVRLQRFIPKPVEEIMNRVIQNLKIALTGFVKTQCVLMGISMAITIIGLLLLQIDNAFAIGVLTGLLDIIPFLGTGTVFIPWIVYLFFTSQYSMVIGLAILYGCIVLTRQIVEPRLLAKSIGLHPLPTLVAIYIGLKWFGLLGMLLSPFVLIVLQTLFHAQVHMIIWTYISIKK